MSSKSLPSSFKQSQHSGNQRTLFYNNSTISRTTDTNSSNKDLTPAYSSSLSSSNVKTSSPLTRAWPNEDTLQQTDTNSSDKSWLMHRWSTVSGSLIIKRKHKKKSAVRIWNQRQKRRTFPPSSDILKQEQKKFRPELLFIHNSSKNRHSLADVLSAFQRYNPSLNSTSSSSLSQRFGKILKKKGKQPMKRTKPTLNVQIEHKSAIMTLFQPPPTISTGSSTPSSPPLKFPTPPKRFSAFFVDSQGRSGKTGYQRPKNSHPHHKFLNLIYHGLLYPKSEEQGVIPSSAKTYKRYKRQLCIHALLFMSGFVFFPSWWIGAWFYFFRRRPEAEHEEEQALYRNDLFSIKTFAYLNAIFSCISFVLSLFIIALIIWMVEDQ